MGHDGSGDEPGRDDVSVLLRAWSDGDQHALDRLTPIVYDELRRLARHYMKRERAGHSLQTTAAAEFQRIVDHPAIVLMDPMGALARLQLARALALSGDTVKAKSTYEDLLTLWMDADPEIPIVEQARTEFARLR